VEAVKDVAAEAARALLDEGYDRAASMLAMLDGLKQRGLLDRVQIVECDTVRVQLSPPPIVVPPLTDEQENAKARMPDPESTLFGASEGMPG
jgi:hypothetical protein